MRIHRRFASIFLCGLGLIACDDSNKTSESCVDSCSVDTDTVCATRQIGDQEWQVLQKCTSGCLQIPEICQGNCVNNKCCPNECDPKTPSVCSSDKRLTTCTLGDDGCYHATTEECSERCTNGACTNSACPNPCSEEGASRCLGKSVSVCTKTAAGCLNWQTQKTCESACSTRSGKAICTETLPTCKLTNNSQALIRQWTDGDTVWVVPVPRADCNDYEKNSSGEWKQVRWRLRIHGIDAPECSKAQNQFYYYTCKQDTKYTNQNDPYGYEAWDWAQKLLPFRSTVTLTCDDSDSKTGVCIYDATADDDADDDQQVYNRYLAYIGYEKNNTSYDFSTELAREGLAFSNTKFKSSKRTDICNASKEAQDNRKNIWSLGNGTVSSVLNEMGNTKQGLKKNMASTCHLK